MIRGLALTSLHSGVFLLSLILVMCALVCAVKHVRSYICGTTYLLPALVCTLRESTVSEAVGLPHVIRRCGHVPVFCLVQVSEILMI